MIPSWMRGLMRKFPLESKWKSDYDDFKGEIIGYYRRNDGHEGVVMQLHDARVVHVYGIQRLTRWETNE
jgi:hypothetical protein